MPEGKCRPSGGGQLGGCLPSLHLGTWWTCLFFGHGEFCGGESGGDGGDIVQLLMGVSPQSAPSQPSRCSPLHLLLHSLIVYPPARLMFPAPCTLFWQQVKARPHSQFTVHVLTSPSLQPRKCFLTDSACSAQIPGKNSQCL